MPLLVFFFLRYSFKALISTFTWAVLKAIPSPQRIAWQVSWSGDCEFASWGHVSAGCFPFWSKWELRFTLCYPLYPYWPLSLRSSCVHIEGANLQDSFLDFGWTPPASQFVRMRDANTQRKRNENINCQNSKASKRAKQFRTWWSQCKSSSWIIHGSTCRTLFDFCWVMNTKALQSGPLLLMIKI